MDRRLLVAMFAVLLAACVHAVPAADIKINAGSPGVVVQSAGLEGTASRFSYDDAKGVLLLEGTASAPVALFRGRGLLATAPRLSYDLTKEVLMLEGTDAIPATLARSRMGPDVEVRATKIIFSLKEGTVRAESVQTIGERKH